MSDQDLQQPVIETSIEEKEPDLREQIAGALKASQETPPDGETPDQRAERLRDAAGRFAKGDAKPRETLTLKQKPEATTTPAAPSPAPGELTPAVLTPAAGVKPPDAWTPAAKAKFLELPSDIQAEITRREADMHKQFTRQDEERVFGRSLKDMAAPYQHVLEAEGAKVQDAFKLYLDTAYVMRTGTPEAKAYGIATVMRQFKVDPQALFSILQGGNGSLSPVLQHAQNPMQQPQGVQPQQVSQLVQAEIDKWRQTQEQTQVQTEIDRFASAEGHEHFNRVRPLMGALLDSGQAKDMQDAYDQATWAHPEIRSTLSAAQQRETEAKRLTEATAKTDAARRASGSLNGGPGGAKPNGAMPNRSLEDEVRANLRAATGRV